MFSQNIHFKFVFIFIILNFGFGASNGENLDTESIISFASAQYRKVVETLSNKPSFEFIHVGDPLKEEWEMNGFERWTAGFYTGILWALFKLTGDNFWKITAEKTLPFLKERQFDNMTHDIGFVIMCSFGHAFENDPNEEYKEIILNAAKTLSTRYNTYAKAIKSWENDEGHGGGEGEVKVIADNMMNLELLFRASELTNKENEFNSIGINHANTTLNNHFREAGGGGTFHVVAFNETNGQVVRKYTWQGYSDDSVWARGQAWIISGFTTVYQFTKYDQFQMAVRNAGEYFINNLPDDFVPYWDYNSPYNTSYQPRDTSAAAVAAFGFLQFYTLTNDEKYLTIGENILRSLNDKYRADGKGIYKILSILVNGTVFYKEENFDTAIVYGDYYFLRALSIYVDIKNLKNVGNLGMPHIITIIIFVTLSFNNFYI